MGSAGETAGLEGHTPADAPLVCSLISKKGVLRGTLDSGDVGRISEGLVVTLGRELGRRGG